MRASKIALVIVGVLMGVVGFGLAAGGSVLVWAHATQRDAAGFYTTPTKRFSTTTYALVSRVDFGAAPDEHDWVPFEHPGTVRLRVTAADQGPMFVGIAPRTDVDRWLAGTTHEDVTSVSYWPFHYHSRQVGGGRQAGLPTGETFWTVSTLGSGTQTLTWPVESGRWAIVVMNADGHAGIATDVQIGAKTGYLLPIGIGVGVAGLLLLAGALVLILVATREETRGPGAGGPTAGAGPETGAAWAGAAPSAPSASAYPARLDGHLDAGLSRWLWLVKWLLVIPHVIVLAFLWVAFVFLTFAAWVSILFTGRYPRSIFDFNVGVMRWTWRVGFYTFSALGTDRYPPFSLQPDPGYPADFAVDYPERLSRGLALVKWWLLAIPHYLVVAFFAGGAAYGAAGNRGWRYGGGGGLIGLLVIIAAIMLAFSGRYPRGLFDLIMGMNRWCVRVFAYAALMRDEYPPFRLDMGGPDPGSVPAAPPPPTPDQPGLLVGAHPGG